MGLDRIGLDWIGLDRMQDWMGLDGADRIR